MYPFQMHMLILCNLKIRKQIKQCFKNEISKLFRQMIQTFAEKNTPITLILLPFD